MTEGNANYTPPALTVDIVLPISDGPLAPVIPDVILCHPDGDTTGGGTAANYVSLSVAATIPYSASGSVVTSRPSRLGIDVVATIPVTGTASFLVERYVTDHTITATAIVTATASGKVTYDSNIVFVSAREIKDSIQQSRHASFYKKGGFENNKIISKKQDIKLTLSLLKSASWFFNFEANEHLSVESNFYFEPSLLVGKCKGMLAEYEPFISTSKQLRNEDASLITLNNKLLFEAMIARRTKTTFVSEYGKLNSRTWHSLSEYNIFTTKVFGIRSEFAKLPSWFKSYTPPSLRRHIILERQDTTLSEQPFEIMLCAPEAMSSGRTNININMKVKSVTAALLLKVLQNEHDDKGVIFVTNSVSLVRSDDGREIEFYAFSISSDIESFAWSFTATLPFTELNKVDILGEDLINVELTVNGFLWKFVIDACDDSSTFNNQSLTIKGQSRSVLLSSPYFNTRSFKYGETLSSRQISEYELNRGSELTGFSIDWNLVDINGWSVPANIYSYIDKTPINVLQDIASSAGGFVNTHPNLDIIKMLPLYPTASWNWGDLVVEKSISDSLITSMGRTRIRKPKYNGILVSGEHENSSSVFARLTGSDGSHRPSMITHPLITEQSVAIERAKSELSKYGDSADVSVSIPLTQDIGFMYPSEFIEVISSDTWIGKVKGVTITGSLGSSRDIKIEQKLRLERHLNGV